MSKKRLFVAVSTLVGGIIGAGILAIPHIVSRAGFLTGLIDIIIIGLLFLLVNLYLGEVVLRTHGHHQLVAYAERYLGRAGQRLMFVSMVVGIYGALIAYLIGQSSALSFAFGIDEWLAATLLFAVLSFIVYLGLGAIAKAESFAVPTVLFIVLLTVIFSFAKIDFENVSEFHISKILIPYGVVFFAFIGTSAIPSLREELEHDKKLMKKAIIIGSLIPIAVYSLFAFAMVGVIGTEVNEIAALSFGRVIGRGLGFLGGLFAVATMSTSFMVLGIALKNMFHEDYKLRKNTSWLLACFVPFIIFAMLKFAGMASFEKVLEITGVITGVITAVLIILMAYIAKHEGMRIPEYTVFMNKPVMIFLVALLILSGILKFVI